MCSNMVSDEETHCQWCPEERWPLSLIELWSGTRTQCISGFASGSANSPAPTELMTQSVKPIQSTYTIFEHTDRSVPPVISRVVSIRPMRSNMAVCWSHIWGLEPLWWLQEPPAIPGTFLELGWCFHNKLPYWSTLVTAYQVRKPLPLVLAMCLNMVPKNLGRILICC